MMRFASALLLALACWAGAADTRIALKTSHNLYSKVVAVWPFATATAEPVDAANALVASPISTAFDGVSGVLPARVADTRGTTGFVPRFTGTEYFMCGSVGNFQRTDKFSVCVIFKKSANVLGRIVCKGTSTVGWRINANANGTIAFRLSNGTSGAEVATPILPVGVWTTQIFTYAGTSLASGVKGYRDGVAQALTINDDDLGTSSITTTVQFGIGAANVSVTPLSFFLGDIAFVAVFNDELTAAEAAQISMNHLDLLELNRTSKTKYVRYLINNGVFRGR